MSKSLRLEPGLSWVVPLIELGEGLSVLMELLLDVLALTVEKGALPCSSSESPQELNPILLPSLGLCIVPSLDP